MSGAANMNAAMADAQRIGDDQFQTIRSLMRDHVGIVLQNNKKALVEARVNRRLRVLGIGDYGDYLDYLSADGSGRELVLLIDAISTNVTHFFREGDHFDFVRETVGGWLAEGRRNLRFWSMACSSGEEPYSLAMTLRAVPGGESACFKILATDISTQILREAVQGVYRKEAVSTIPPGLAKRYLVRSPMSDDEVYGVHESLKNMVVFRRMNLNKTPYPIQGIFDIIMCRNVMIYFDRELRSRIVAEAHRLLRPGGYLLVGHAETLLGMDSRFEFVRPSVYRRL